MSTAGPHLVSRQAGCSAPHTTKRFFWQIYEDAESCKEMNDVESNRQMGAETKARSEGLDAVQAALRAADEIAAALQAHLTQEHGAHVQDRAHAVAPTLDLLRHARERIAAGLREAKQQGLRSDG